MGTHGFSSEVTKHLSCVSEMFCNLCRPMLTSILSCNMNCNLDQVKTALKRHMLWIVLLLLERIICHISHGCKLYLVSNKRYFHADHPQIHYWCLLRSLWIQIVCNYKFYDFLEAAEGKKGYMCSAPNLKSIAICNPQMKYTIITSIERPFF